MFENTEKTSSEVILDANRRSRSPLAPLERVYGDRVQEIILSKHSLRAYQLK
jgi:hypothetical protein